MAVQFKLLPSVVDTGALSAEKIPPKRQVDPHLHFMLRLRMNGALPPLRNMPSRLAKEKVPFPNLMLHHGP